MAVALTQPWEAAVEKNIRDFYDTLSEQDRRRTIERGFAELDELPHDPAAGQVRRPGAGRKKKSSPTRPSNRI